MGSRWLLIECAQWPAARPYWAGTLLDWAGTLQGGEPNWAGAVGATDAGTPCDGLTEGTELGVGVGAGLELGC